MSASSDSNTMMIRRPSSARPSMHARVCPAVKPSPQPSPPEATRPSSNTPAATTYAQRLATWARRRPLVAAGVGLLVAILVSLLFRGSASPTHEWRGPNGEVVRMNGAAPIALQAPSPVLASTETVRGLIPAIVATWTRKGNAEVTRVRAAEGTEIVHARATYASEGGKVQLSLWNGTGASAPSVGVWGVEFESDEMHVRPISHDGRAGMERVDRKRREVAVCLRTGKFVVSVELKGCADPAEAYRFLDALDLSAIASVE